LTVHFGLKIKQIKSLNRKKLAPALAILRDVSTVTGKYQALT